MITRIELHNCGPFRGDHVIELGTGAYAIVAMYADDEKKSNGVGKSYIFEMIDFAITGRLNPSREGGADRWINNDEREATVAITFEDGAKIVRSKKRGQSTQVRFTAPGTKEAAQDAASAAVLKHIAMSTDDFRNAAYFEQRKMARLVDPDQTSPANRLEIVSGWFGLGLAERAEERAGDLASEHERTLTKLITEKTALASRFSLHAVNDDSDIEALTKEVEHLGLKVRLLQADRAEARTVERHQAIVNAQADRISTGKALRDKLATMADVAAEADSAREELEVLARKVSETEAEVKRKKKVALGLFDGACPVAPLTCPATKQINADRKGTTAALEEARTAHAVATAAHSESCQKYGSLFAQQREYTKVAAQLENMRESVRKNADAVKESKAYLAKGFGRTEMEIDAEIAEVQSALNAANTKLGIAKNEKLERERTALSVKELDAKIEKQTRLVTLHLKARAMFRVAQRRVAERNLGFVENEANYQLADAGIDLSVKARWEREASGPAKTCDTCGAAFPSSAKIKVCDRCGSSRGQHTVQRLDFMLSDRSGALNDLGGVAMQLAAGAWLLGARHSPWACAMLDEPFAACDGHNRRALAVQLLKLLSRGMFRQALVISHSPDTVDLYPHKIVIIANADGTRRIEQR